MKNIIDGVVLGISIFLGMYIIPKVLLLLGVGLGGLGQVILLIILSLSIGCIFLKILKKNLKDVVNALACVTYSILYVIMTSLIDYSGQGVVTFTDKIVLAAGASLLIFISLSLVGKIFEKKKI